METNRKSWCGVFFEEDFSVDNCLAKYSQQCDLETLKKELKEYGIDLHHQVTEILKTETETIVNLAEYLTNLHAKIEDLSLPICQLQEEIKTTYGLINTTKEEFEKILTILRTNSVNKNNLDLKMEITSSCIDINEIIKTNTPENVTRLERAVNKYAFKKMYLKELGITVSDILGNMTEMESKLLEIFNKQFLTAIKNRDNAVILRCLHLYDNLEKQDEAEKVYQVGIIRPALQNILCASNFAMHSKDLDKVYNELLKFLESEMGCLLTVLKQNPELKSFNFILNSFWTEVSKQSKEGLPYITAPGNPDLFQKRFKSTWDFCIEIATKCGDKNLVRNSEKFRKHIKRFNLPVYFEIKYQQISSSFERLVAVKPSEQMFISNKELNFKLRITEGLWDSVQLCFREDIFLEHLSDQFLKLSVLLLSRYLKWLQVHLLAEDAMNGDIEKWQKFIIYALIDLAIIENLMGFDTEDTIKFNSSVYYTIPLQFKDYVCSVIKINKQSILVMYDKLQNQLINLKVNNSMMVLQNVGAIPRLYRKTNKTVPKTPSNYVTEAVKSIAAFDSSFKPVIQDKLPPIVDAIIFQITKEYSQIVQQVLHSVCKTEESLRRLKGRISSAAEDNAQDSDTVSDEMKIREQIRLDVLFFIDELYPLGLIKSKGALDNLRSIIIS